VSNLPARLAKIMVLSVLAALVGWPLTATVIEAAGLPRRRLASGLATLGVTGWARTIHQSAAPEPEPATGNVIDPVATATLLSTSGSLSRPARLALETLRLVMLTEIIVLPPGILLALLLFRTDVSGRGFLIVLLGVAAFVPLPLHATAWLGALGNAGRTQAIGVRPILVGREGAAVVAALAALPWVVLLSGVGLRTVEPELEESAALDLPVTRVCTSVTLRRSAGAIAATALAVAVLTSGDMTVTDLLQVRTYAEEAYVQFTLGRGPADAAVVSIPPLVVLGVAILVIAGALGRADPARLASAFSRYRVWKLGQWRVPLGAALIFLVGNLAALPLYSLVWRAGRVGGKARLGHPPVWSFGGLAGTLRLAAFESWQPIQTSLILAAAAATLAVILAWSLAWLSRRSRIWQSLVLILLALTLATPGPVAGMTLELAYRRLPAIYDSAMILVMAQAVRTLPYAILVLWPALWTLPRELLESASLDGHGPCALIWHVALPLSWRARLASWFVVFVLAFGELPATNLLQPPGTTTITFLIWTLLHTGVESHLAGVALVMLLVMTAAAFFAVTVVRLAVRGGIAISGALSARSGR
jgi:iron(III) transport system permease protein